MNPEPGRTDPGQQLRAAMVAHAHLVPRRDVVFVEAARRAGVYRRRRAAVQIFVGVLVGVGVIGFLPVLLAG